MSNDPMKEEWDNGIVMRFFNMLKRNWKILLGVIVAMGLGHIVLSLALGIY